MKKTNLMFSLAVFILTAVNTNAQIVYTDINPDVTTTLNSTVISANNIIAIDFDSDGTEEYNFRWDDYGTSGWFMHMTYANGNTFNLDGTATNPFGGRYLKAMNQGETINSSLNWGASSPEPFIGDNADSNFQNLGDKYVGVKFLLGTNTYYGWVLVSFDNSKKLTVKEYAYQSTPNTAINAGDKGTTGVNDLKNNQYFSIYPNPATNFIEIKTDLEYTLFTIIDLTGKTVKTIKNQSKTDISDLNKGIYLIKIIGRNNTTIQKFVKE